MQGRRAVITTHSVIVPNRGLRPSGLSWNLGLSQILRQIRLDKILSNSHRLVGDSVELRQTVIVVEYTRIKLIGTDVQRFHVYLKHGLVIPETRCTETYLVQIWHTWA